MRKEFDRVVRHKANQDFDSDEFLVSKKCHRTNRYDGGCFSSEFVEAQLKRQSAGYKADRSIHKMQGK